MVGELILDQFEIFVLAERKVVDLVGEIEGIALDHQTHEDVRVGVGGDVEVAWDPINLEVTFKLATLLGVNLFLHSVHEIHPVVNLIESRCLGDHFSAF